MFRKIILLVMIALVLSGCAATPEENISPDTPTPEPTSFDGIIFDFDNLYPNGIEYDENGERFLLGSRSEGAIFQVSDDGTIEPFIEDPDLMECEGLEIDRNNQRLLVVSNDESEGKSSLSAYDLATGERIFLADISSIKPDRIPYAWDVAVDPDGNAYVTDSGSWLNDEATPAIYRIDQEGNPTLFMEHPLFDYLGGIVYHPDGFLLLGSAPGLLLKIPLADPEVIKVDITDGHWGFSSINSMIMHPDGTLIMLTYPDKKVGRLKSDDNWETAQVVGLSSEHKEGSTIAMEGEEVYIIYSYSTLGGLEKQRTFKIVHVILE